VPKKLSGSLTPREREVLEILYRLGQGTVHDVRAAMEQPPGYNSVRSVLEALDRKGNANHQEGGRRFLYKPAEPSEAAARKAIRNLADIFFEGSLAGLVRTCLSDKEAQISGEDLDHIIRLAEDFKTRLRPDSGNV